MEIINFNHVSSDLNHNTLKTIEKLYIYYHRLSWCHKKNYWIYNLKEKNGVYAGTILVATGTIIDGMTLNPATFTTIDAKGAALIAFSKKGKFAQKAETKKRKQTLESAQYGLEIIFNI